MVKTACQLTVLFTWLAQSAAIPLRIGEVAQQLSEEDVAAIGRILPSGAKPWLLNGDHGNAGGVQFIEAYLPPRDATPVLRRGTVTEVTRHIPSAFSPEATAWTVLETRSYAQVAIPGRRFDQIDDDQDINRPFNVSGRFDDDELVRLVQFLRSNTATPERVQSWPILIIGRKADGSVEVFLRGGVGHGQVIMLRQAGQDWMIMVVTGWMG